MSTTLAPSIVRTLVPWIVAWLISWLPAELGLTSDQLATAATLAVGAAWYVAVRVLEVYFPKAGILLGWTTAPVYPVEPSQDDDRA